jgi:hypothetical protein
MPDSSEQLNGSTPLAELQQSEQARLKRRSTPRA